MCWSRALLTGWMLLQMLQVLCVEAVPISMDKTKVKVPEQTPEEPPASVVRGCATHSFIHWLRPGTKYNTCSSFFLRHSFKGCRVATPVYLFLVIFIQRSDIYSIFSTTTKKRKRQAGIQFLFHVFIGTNHPHRHIQYKHPRRIQTRLT